LRKANAAFEYLRALRYELRMLPRLDLVQVCSGENRKYLLSFLPQLEGRVDDTLRAGIDAAVHDFRPRGREPYTMLFLGSFRHTPNQEALDWFAWKVMPLVVKACPNARLAIVGSDPPPRHSLPVPEENLDIRGFVEDAREPLARYAVFVCPILSGSGVRVKLLEAFAAGMPVVSTRLGAEGLAENDGDVCLLADDPQEFADRVVRLFEHPDEGEKMAERARAAVIAERDITGMMARLDTRYREAVKQKRG
jgi:glycosyltransferase involved in cell wall biosynthesis